MPKEKRVKRSEVRPLDLCVFSVLSVLCVASVVSVVPLTSLTSAASASLREKVVFAEFLELAAPVELAH